MGCCSSSKTAGPDGDGSKKNGTKPEKQSSASAPVPVEPTIQAEAAAPYPVSERPEAPTLLDRQIFEFQNKVRTDPAGVAADWLTPRLENFDDRLMRQADGVMLMTHEGAEAVEEAIAVLNAQAPLAPLIWDDELWKAARDHCFDTGAKGLFGHTGSDGSNLGDRLARYGDFVAKSGESCGYGSATAEEHVLQLLIDDGVPTRGHRKNMLDHAFQVVGCASGPHAKLRTCAVLDYAGGFMRM